MDRRRDRSALRIGTASSEILRREQKRSRIFELAQWPGQADLIECLQEPPSGHSRGAPAISLGCNADRQGFCRRPSTVPAVLIFTRGADHGPEPNADAVKVEPGYRRRPPSSTCRRVPQQRCACWHGSPPTDATPRAATLQADRVDAAKTTSFCASFCASSSSQSFSPRTSSSIWLSSPYCPPSHRDGDLRNSAVANRHALHSDYYSTTEKTATPLNEWWTARTSAILAVRTVSELDTRNDPLRSCARITRPEISSAHENPCGTRISRMRADVHPMCPKSWRASASISRQPAGAVLGGFLAPKKIFAPSRPRAARKRKFRSRAPNRGPIRFPARAERSP